MRWGRFGLVLVAVASASGCSSPADRADAGGEDGGRSDAACALGCAGDDLMTCAGPVVPCPLGCTGTGASARCGELDPANLDDLADLDGVDAGLTVDDRGGDTWRILTDTGEITAPTGAGREVVRAAGTGLIAGIRFRVIDGGRAVLALDHLTIPAGLEIEAYGQRALIVLARGPITVAGTLDVSGGGLDGAGQIDLRLGGPGGGAGARHDDLPAGGCAPGGSVDYLLDEPGGGGGGFGGDGGAGGAADSNAGGGGGAAMACAASASLDPVVGGSGGGANLGTSFAGEGGGGGGALQLTSLERIELTATGVVDAGGRGGFSSTGSDSGGGGGGSGGAVLIEAAAVEIASGAVIAANGGGGGAGEADGSTAAAGQPGLRAAVAAAGAAGPGGSGSGGAGAAGLTLAQPGGAQPAGSFFGGGGGGGGGVGVVRVYARAPTISPTAVVSPVPTVRAPSTR
ncbi:MAG: hypothetical protein KBG28_14665 [Kofleriaceae bacterium]|nr:hypothetical protein [Kofleriaceae bacterium]